MLFFSRLMLAMFLATLLPYGQIAFAQSTPMDRSAYFDDNTNVSDDLRRVPVPPGFQDPGGYILLKNARLFDGTGAAPRTADILLKGKVIANIGQELEAPDGTRIIDANGRTVMPGLIDMHTHVTYVDKFGLPDELSDLSQSDATLRGVERLRAYVENGITSVRDTGSHGMAPFTLKRWLGEGRIAGPRLFAAGQVIVGQGGHGTEGFVFATSPDSTGALAREANGADDWVAAVREQFKRGADLIKLASHYTPEEVNAAIEEAHRLGLRVVVDAETRFTEVAVDAGADVIEHPLPRTPATIEKMVKNNVASVPTFVPYQYIIKLSGGYFGSTSRRFTLTENFMFREVKKMKDAGIKLGVGTDLIVDWFKYLPAPYIQELKNFERLDYTPAEALIAATRTNAEILGMDDKIGTIEIGKLADIIIVDGKPDLSVDDLAHVDTVIVGGRVMVENDQVVFPAPFKSLPSPLDQGK